MLSLFRLGGRVIGVTGLLGCALATPLQAQNQSVLAQNGAQQQAFQKPMGTLQVSGTIEKFTLSANRADVLETLKMVFEQAEKQFVPIGNLTGTVTLRLSEQPLVTTLDAICAQTFLRYRFDANKGIFFIERNDEAVRGAILRLRQLDTEMRNQLRLMGLTLPTDYALGYNLQNGTLIPVPRGLNGTFGGGAGGSGGFRAALPNNSASLAPADSSSNRENSSPLPKTGRGQNTPNTEGATPDGYNLFLKSNSLVYFAAKEKPTPIYDILQQFGLQAGVPLLIDPSVPKGSKFVVKGTLSPRPLPDALNLLAPYARLEWRWLGDSIFVSTTPEFELLLQDVSVAKVTGNAERSRQREVMPNNDKKGETNKDKLPPNN